MSWSRISLEQACSQFEDQNVSAFDWFGDELANITPRATDLFPISATSGVFKGSLEQLDGNSG
jgi:hypothetical protein